MPAESAARTVNVLETAFDAVVPEMTPVDVFNDNPAGKDPDVRLHVVAPLAPDVVKVWEYELPIGALAKDVVVTTKGTTTVNVYVADALPSNVPSLTSTVKV